MRIGVITNTDTFIPFAYALAGQQIPLSIYFLPPPDDFIDQKVTAFAQQFNLNITKEKNPADLYTWLHKNNFDVCLMLGYKHLIKLDKLKACPTLLLNIHFGTLPAYRGSTPVFWQLKHGQKIGATIHKVSEKFDDGPIYWLKEVDIQPHFNYEVANQVLGQICVEGVFYILSLLFNKMPLPVIPGIGNRAYQQRPALKDISINWQQMPAQEICNLIQACNPWNKGASTIFNQQEVKLMDAWIIDAGTDALPGTIVNDEHYLHIQCADKKVIAVNMLYYNSFFLPTHQAKLFGFGKGAVLGK